MNCVGRWPSIRAKAVKVLIIGLNHQIQVDAIRSIGPEIEQLEGEQKDRLAQAIDRIIQREKPPAERSQKGIPPDYLDTNHPYTPKQRDAWNSEREQHMVQSAISSAGTSDTIIILCGRDHTDSLAKRFHDLGHVVETYDLNQENWYVEDWL